MNANEKYANGQRKYAQDGSILTYYFEDGGVKAQGKIINGAMEGRWIFNKKGGRLWQIGHFSRGQKDGSWTRYNDDGSVEKQQHFKDGKEHKSP